MARLGSTRLASTRLASAWLGSLGSARLGTRLQTRPTLVCSGPAQLCYAGPLSPAQLVSVRLRGANNYLQGEQVTRLPRPAAEARLDRFPPADAQTRLSLHLARVLSLISRRPCAASTCLLFCHSHAGARLILGNPRLGRQHTELASSELMLGSPDCATWPESETEGASELTTNETTLRLLSTHGCSASQHPHLATFLVAACLRRRHTGHPDTREVGHVPTARGAEAHKKAHRPQLSRARTADARRRSGRCRGPRFRFVLFTGNGRLYCAQRH